MSMNRCTWPKGCLTTAYDGGLCYYHIKCAAGTFEATARDPSDASPADILSDRQLELALLAANLGASPADVKRALAKEKR
jgi:hypothetical protein